MLANTNGDGRWHFVSEIASRRQLCDFTASRSSSSGQRSRQRHSSEPPPFSRHTSETAVRSDLEAFFETFDSSRRFGDRMLPGLKVSEMTKLRCLRHQGSEEPQSSSEDSVVECVVCLTAFQDGDKLLEMPCDFRHRLHEHCARTWLARSAACPICRIDVRTRLPECKTTKSTPMEWDPLAGSVQDRGQALYEGAYTRDGGVILRFEPTPPADWQRPVYIPPHLWHLAQYFEVSYPGVGAAHVWRVPGVSASLAGGA